MNRRLSAIIASAAFGLSAAAAGAQTLDNGATDARQLNHVRVSNDALVKAAELGVQPRLDLNYGAFRWMALTNDDLATLQAAGVDVTPASKPFTLRLGERSFDPVIDGEPIAPAGLAAARADGPDLRLVQFVGPTKQTWLDDLEARGLKVVKYVHPHTYVVWGQADQRENLADMTAVRWSGDFKPAYRLLPRYRDEAARGGVDRVRVMLYRGADADQVVNQLNDLGARNVDRAVIDDTFEFVRFDADLAKLEDIANVPGVYSVKTVPTDGGLRGEMFNQVNVNNVDGTNAAFPGYLAYLSGISLDGNGVIIANVDGGVQNDHPDLVNRLIGCTGPTCGGATTSSHGTHTAGIMAGDATSGTTDSFGFLRGLGVAPGASLVEQVYSPHFTEPGGMLKLMKDSYNNGASLSGNSWGPSGFPQGYDDDTYQVDVGVRDAVDDQPGNQPLTFVLSFMNGNGGTSSQGSPDEAKNLFNIGSTKGQTSGGTQILDIDDLSSNTAHGPALDGRTIPHMVAPGCSIDSTDSGSSYSLKCGTSMASPHVSGAVALFIEHYRNRPDYTADPSPALVKAAFLPVARSLAGNLDADGGVLGEPFDSKQGWGRMDLAAVLESSDVAYYDGPQLLNNTGEEWTVSVSPANPGQPMRMMLVWTDAPGHGLGGSTPAWNNDLDLIVEAGANTYYGNNIDGSGWSAAGGSPDAINNTEGVFLGPIPPGGVTIRVRASDINSDGVPGVGDTTDQDFALVVYNAAEEPGFALSSTPNAVETCNDVDVDYTIDVGTILGFSDPVTLSASGAPAGASVSFSPNPVTPGASSTMTVSGLAGAAAGSYNITIDGVAAALMRSTAVSLDLSTAIPGAPSITAPGNGATGVSLVPTITWNAATQAAEYTVEISDSAGFGSIIDSGMTADTSYISGVTLNPSQLYYARVSASNACGDGPDSTIVSFTTRDVPAILLVDDDDNSPDARGSYADALAALGLDYDVWDTNNTDNEPAFADLAQYRVVIWFTGDEFGGVCGPGGPGEAALGQWLDTGDKCLVISSQDYYFDRGTTPFMTTYLGMSTATSDVSQTTVTGAGSVFGSFGSLSLNYPFSNWSDRLSPNGSAELAFSGNAGDAAINYDSGSYRTTFFGFPLEALSLADRTNVLSTAIDWCAPAPPDCPGDANGDLVVNFDDLNEVLTNWNQPVAAGTNGDVTGNGFVDFDDLNEVLTFWEVNCN